MSDQDNEEIEILKEEEKNIREALKHTPYLTLLKIKKNIEKTQVNQDDSDSDKEDRNHTSKKKERIPKTTSKEKPLKTSKSKPLERSARIPVKQNLPILNESKKKIGRDPRFDNLSGHFNKDLFEKSYCFLKDKKINENKELSKALKKKGYTQDEKERLRQMLHENKNDLAREQQFNRANEIKKEFKRKNLMKVKKGLDPFFPKKKIVKEKVLENKFLELEKKGKLDKYMQEKKKRQSNKIENRLDNLIKIKENKLKNL